MPACTATVPAAVKLSVRAAVRGAAVFTVGIAAPLVPRATSVSTSSAAKKRATLPRLASWPAPPGRRSLIWVSICFISKIHIP